MFSIMKWIQKNFNHCFYVDVFRFFFIFQTVCERKQKTRIQNRSASNRQKWNETFNTVFFEMSHERENLILNNRAENRDFCMNFNKIVAIFRRRFFHDDHESFDFENDSSDEYERKTFC